MYDQPAVISIRPDREGTGGSKTGVPSISEINDIRLARNVVIKNGRWENVAYRTPIAAALTASVGHIVLYPYIYHSVFPGPVTSTVKVLCAGTGPNQLLDFGPCIFNGSAPGVIPLTLSANMGLASMETVKEICYYVDGASVPQAMDFRTLTQQSTTYSGTALPYQWGIPVGPSITSFQYDPNFIQTGTTFNVVNGNATITVVGGPALLATYDNPGKTIYLASDANPASEQTSSRFTIITGTVNVGAGTMQVSPTPAFSRNPSQSIINFGSMSWGGTGAASSPSGPQYAVSYYDSVRAHSGNIGPIFRLIDPEKHNVNVKISFAAATTAAGLPFVRCNQLILWSSTVFSIGGNLFPLQVIANSNDLSGTHNYTQSDNRTDDNVLGTVIGPFQAPQFGPSGNDPPKNFTSIAYWNGVMWGLAPTGPLSTDYDLSLLYYSRNDDPGLLGRGEESFPATNVLRIPAKDGRGLGLFVVGDTLMVMTERYLYQITGVSPDTYRLSRLSSKGLGVGPTQIAEFAGDADNQSAAALFVGQDRIVWAQAPGSAAVNLSVNIQDELDRWLRGSVSAQTYPFTRMYYVTTGGASYAVVLLR